MIKQGRFSEVINSQKKYFVSKRTDLTREALSKIPIREGYATIITGMRRCGKCTLLLQMQKEIGLKEVLYLNFEDIRFAGFEREELPELKKEILSRNPEAVFFDEIHIIPKWEGLVKELLDEKIKVFITDTSNSLCDLPFALNMELFPFSYKEYIHFSKQEINITSFSRYMKVGGIPKNVRNEGTPILNNILDDILIRDIAVPKGIRDIEALRLLAVYLLSNIGTKVSANQLVGRFNIKSCATIVDYFNLFSEYYLMEMIPKFSPSSRVRSRNPKRVYALDLGLIHLASITPASNQQNLENLVYIDLRKRYREISYFSEKGIGECHFVISESGTPVMAIAAKWKMSEYDLFLTCRNLVEVANHLNLKKVCIISQEKKETLIMKGVTINITPAYDYIS